MYILKYLLLCFLVLNTSVFFSQVSENHFRIYSSREAKEVSVVEIVDNMRNYDVLFFGEEHDDSVSHYLENRILELMSEKYGPEKIALSLEMFDRDVQVVMNEYLAGWLREKNFRKDARVWNNYNDYRSMVEFVKMKKIDVICANAPSRYTNLAGRKGQGALKELSPEAKTFFAPLPYDTASGPYYEKLMSMSGHTAPSKPDTMATKTLSMPMAGFNLVQAQSLWDATMAWSVSTYLKKNKGKKVLQINGRFHSDQGYAVVTQLKKYSPKLRSLIITSGKDDSFPDIDWNLYSGAADYIIITDPAIPGTHSE